MLRQENGSYIGERTRRLARRAGVVAGAGALAASAAACSGAGLGPHAPDVPCALYGYDLTTSKWTASPLTGTQLPETYPLGSMDFQVKIAGTPKDDLTGQVKENNGAYDLYYVGGSASAATGDIGKGNVGDITNGAAPVALIIEPDHAAWYGVTRGCIQPDARNILLPDRTHPHGDLSALPK